MMHDSNYVEYIKSDLLLQILDT
jgi:transcriptional regulator with GAF, ATPase, and Fis domain